MQILVRQNIVVAWSESEDFLCMGPTTVCLSSGETFEDCTIAFVDKLPQDIAERSYLYVGGQFVRNYSLQNPQETAAELNKHTEDKTNPHAVTKEQVGLGLVPNVATNDQTPTFTQATKLTNISSGEKLKTIFGKVQKAIAELITHLADSTKHITSSERAQWNNYVDRFEELEWVSLGSVSYSGSHTQTSASSKYEVAKKEVVNIPCDADILKEFTLFRYIIKAGSSFNVQGTSTAKGTQESGVIVKSNASGILFTCGCQFYIASSAANNATLTDEYSYTVTNDLVIHSLEIGTDRIREIKNGFYNPNNIPSSSNSPSTLATLEITLGDFGDDSYGFWGTTSAQCAFTIELQGKR